MHSSATLVFLVTFFQSGAAFKCRAPESRTTRFFSTTKDLQSNEVLSTREDVARAREMILSKDAPKSRSTSAPSATPTFPTSLASVAKPAPSQPRKSAALPFAMAPAVLDGSLAGDSGFDPVGFADSREKLYVLREAELKHARLAMLAAAGWPVAELFQPFAARTLGMSSALNVDGRNPSVLNGFTSHWQDPVFVAVVFAAVAAIELGTLNRQFIPPKDSVRFDSRGAYLKQKEGEGFVSGDFGFDPFGASSFFGASDQGRKAMRTAEIKNGRLAMLAITGFAIQEFALKESVVLQTPIFFEPFWRVVADLMTGDALPPLYTQ